MSALPQPVESQTTGYREAPSVTLPAAPPRELAAAVAAAAGRAAALAAAGRELNFAVDAAGALRVEVRDLEGNVLKIVSPSHAVAVMAGLGRI